MLDDGQKERAYWLYVQAYFTDYPTAKLFAAGQTINVRIPTSNRINRHAIQEIRRYKEDLRQQASRKVDHHV